MTVPGSFSHCAPPTASPLRPLGLDLPSVSDPLDLLDGIVQIHDILAHGASVAVCLAAASDSETLPEKDRKQALQVLAAYLEGAREAVWQWQQPLRRDGMPPRGTEATAEV